MPLNTKTDAQFAQDFINAWAAVLNLNPVFTTGAIINALAEAAASLDTFLQFQAQYATFFARLTTCKGPDVDSWLAQFRFPREGAQFATGEVTLSVSSPQPNALTIPVGTIVQTVNGAIQYQLVADTSQPAYNIGLNAYVLPASTPLSPVLSITASVQALVAGSASNVLAGQLIQFSSSSFGITGVTNEASIDDGSDQESDDAYKNRFFLYINSLSKGTFQAILEACLSTFPNFTYSILSNTTPPPDSMTVNGFFTVVANNPGQTVTTGQKQQLFQAIDPIRAFTIQFAVIAAVSNKPAIQMNVSIVAGADAPTVLSTVQLAVIGYINSLDIGKTLYLTNLIRAAEDSSTQVTSVEFSSVTINGSQLDLSVDQFHVIQADLTTVTIGQYAG